MATANLLKTKSDQLNPGPAPWNFTLNRRVADFSELVVKFHGIVPAPICKIVDSLLNASSGQKTRRVPILLAGASLISAAAVQASDSVARFHSGC